jgi:hypothetical protein
MNRIHNATETPGDSMAEIEEIVVASNNLTTQTRLDISIPTNQPDEDILIDVDAFENKDIPEQPKASSVRACEGYTLNFQNGNSPHTTYPFALHDAIVLPWDYALKNGRMKLFSRSCHKKAKGLDMACQACQNLAKNEKLENILH